MRSKQRKSYGIKRRNSLYKQSKALSSNSSTNTESVQQQTATRRVPNKELSIDLSKRRKSKIEFRFLFDSTKVTNKFDVNYKRTAVGQSFFFECFFFNSQIRDECGKSTGER